MQTKRPQNKCGTCGYTWYPKGSNLSRKCPSCGSGNTETIKVGSLGAVVLCLLLFLYLVTKNSPNDNQAPAQDSALTSSTDTTTATAPTVADTSNQPVIESQPLEQAIGPEDNQAELKQPENKSPAVTQASEDSKQASPGSNERQKDSPKIDTPCPIPGHC